MGIGLPLATASIAIASDLLLAAAGIALVTTVIAGLIIFFNVGGATVGKFVRQHISTLFWGFLFTGGAGVLTTGFQRVLTLH